ncbi:MAG: CDP-alcohol phosphatidyltransferase family protein [Candidatus Aenigmarchaeota archaeon]|nr:CDP-alcohol phosphatidyltransferase family protein [Candidatus Aenigmarchaeota archaeon]
MLYKNREKFESIGRFVGKKMSGVPVTPNQWTLISFLLSILSAYFIIMGRFAEASAVFALAALSDMVDGSVARYRNSAVPKGAFYDTVVDRYVEFIVIVSLMASGLPPFFIGANLWITALLFGSIMTTFVRAAAMRELGIEVKGGLVERGERMILLFLGILSASFNVMYLVYFIALLAVLTNVSALQRISASVKRSG